MTENAIDLRGAAVLIVDDVPDNLDILCRSLDKADYDVLVATSGAQAIDIATRARPELILLDVRKITGMSRVVSCILSWRHAQCQRQYRYQRRHSRQHHARRFLRLFFLRHCSL